MKKFVSLFLAVLMALSLSVTAFAAGTGSITIKDNPNDPGLDVAGKTFNAYKVLDLAVDGDEYTYTVPEALKAFFAARYSLTVENNQLFDLQVTAGLNDEINATDFDGYAFAAELLAAAKAANVVPKSAVGGTDSATITGLDVGYYVIEDAGKSGDTTTAISALMLRNTNINPEVTVKGSMPGITKNILTTDPSDNNNDDNGDGMVKTNNGSIGDLVPYVLNSKVPSNLDGYKVYTYIIHDQMSKGITFQDDVIVKVGGSTLNRGTDYTVTTAAITAEGEYEGGTAITIELKDFLTKYKNQPGAAIEIYYSGKINEDAVIGELLGNPNKVRLEYSNNPNVLVDPDDPTNPPDDPNDEPFHPTGITPWDEVRTYITEVKIIKTDAQGNRLVGARFTLTGDRVVKVIVETLAFTESENGTYWKLTDGSYTTTDPTTEGVDTADYASTTVKYVKNTNVEVQEKTGTVTVTGTTNDAGELVFSGLGAGTYTLTEVAAPDGYNLLKQPIGLTITWEEPAAESTTCTWAYTWQNANGQGGEVTIVNNIGTVLPETGGMGTTLFYIAGGILVLAAVVLLITKKRMSRED